MSRLTVIGAALIIATGSTDVVAREPTVVELFQSQGCSSCPPAIGNVNALADRPGVLTLTFAVTYWDQLGWKDSFASPEQTARQWDYARGLHHAQVWTPQVVVDGRVDVVGVLPGEVAALLDRLPARTGAALKLAVGSVAIGGGAAPAGGADVWLVRFDPRTVAVAVAAGENAGRTIAHRNVVRSLTRLGHWSGTAATLPLPAAVPGLASAVLVQTRGGPILAAARG